MFRRLKVSRPSVLFGACTIRKQAHAERRSLPAIYQSAQMSSREMLEDYTNMLAAEAANHNDIRERPPERRKARVDGCAALTR